MGFIDLAKYGVAVQTLMERYQGSYSCMHIAQTWYVSKDGDNANDGLTPKTPKLTIQAAVNAAASGDQITIAAGVYDEGLDASNVNGLVIDKVLTLNGAGFSTVIINTIAGAVSVVHMEGKTGTDKTGNKFLNLVIEGNQDRLGGPWTEHGLVIDYDYRFLLIENCAITSSDNCGVRIEPEFGDRIVQIRNCILSNPVYNIYMKAPEGSLSDDQMVVLFCTDSFFFISGDFGSMGNNAGVYVDGDYTNDHKVGFAVFQGCTFQINASAGAVHFGEKSQLCAASRNTFGYSFIEFGAGPFLRDDNWEGFLGGIGNSFKDNSGLYTKEFNSHPSAAGVTLNDGGAPGVFGAWTEISGPSGPTLETFNGDGSANQVLSLANVSVLSVVSVTELGVPTVLTRDITGSPSAGEYYIDRITGEVTIGGTSVVGVNNYEVIYNYTTSPAKHFSITNFVADTVSNADVYWIDIGIGPSGAEMSLGVKRIRYSATFVPTISLDIDARVIPPGTRTAVRIASATGGYNIAGSLEYQVQE